jgi:hypothetical protein
MKRSLFAVPAIAAALLLAGCAGSGPSASDSPTPSESASPSPSPTSETPSAGDCTATDGDAPAIPVIYTVFTGDDTTPVTMTYTAFNVDGTTPDITEDVVGPVVVRIGYACVGDSSGGIWTLTATTSSPDSIGCVLAFGGKLVATDSRYNEGATTPQTADCSGNPGR